jgi:hypothetical protein
MHRSLIRVFLSVGVVASMLTLAHKASAQFHETIRTGRPGQSIGTYAVGRGLFQLQSGIDYFGSSGAQTGSGWLTNNVLRYGIIEPWEVNALIEGRTETSNGNALSGISALEIGTRYHILTRDKWIPNVGLQFRLRLPGDHGDYILQSYIPRLTLAVSQKLSEKFFLILNWTQSGGNEESVPKSFYTANFSYALTDRLGIFLENFGTTSPQGWKFYLDGGFAYLVTNDLQLDWSAEFGNNRGVSEWYVSAGVSWRTSRKQ